MTADFTFTEAAVSRLHTRWMDITEDEVREGLTIAEAHGIEGADAQEAVFRFLEHLTPYWEALSGRLDPAEITTNIRFVGWYALSHVMRALLDACPVQLRNEVLARAWGNDGVRFAAAVIAKENAS